MLKLIKNFINGMAFGITQIVPGVSGGTIAIIMGFYNELIGTINNFSKDYKKSLSLLIPLLFGIAAGILVFSSIINFLLMNYSFPTMTFFIGLIVGIIPPVYLKVKEPGRRFNFKEIALIILPIIILLIISNLRNDTAANPSEDINNVDIYFMLFLFFAGLISAAALIIPGISGSFILLLLGVYPLLTYSISLIGAFLTDITNIPLMLNIIRVLMPFGIGVIIGGLFTAKLIGKLLNNYSKIIYSVILGLIIGSVYVLFNDPIVYQSGMSALIVVTGLITFIAGCVISFVLGKKRL